jgi:hypothetical protein
MAKTKKQRRVPAPKAPQASPTKPEVIFRPWITRGGKRIYARQYGLRAFPIPVP